MTVPFRILQKPVTCEYVCHKMLCKECIRIPMTKLSKKDLFREFVFVMQIDVLCFSAIASEHKEGFVNSLNVET